MNAEAVSQRLAELGLRMPAAGMPAFTALVADMQAAAEIARRPLPYACEPAAIFALPSPPARPSP